MARSTKKSKTITARYTLLPVKWMDMVENSNHIFAVIDIEPYMGNYIGPYMATIRRIGIIKAS